MTTRNFTISFDDICWSCRIEIDPDFKCTRGEGQITTMELIKEMVEFWYEWPSRLEDQEGDYIRTFALQLGKECFVIAYSNNYNIKGVTDEFADKEGYVPMNGSHGIWIKECDSAEIGDQFFSLKEHLTDKAQ